MERIFFWVSFFILYITSEEVVVIFQKKMSNNITDILPSEMILKILKHMNHSDLISFGLSSKKCKDYAVEILR